MDGSESSKTLKNRNKRLRKKRAKLRDRSVVHSDSCVSTVECNNNNNINEEGSLAEENSSSQIRVSFSSIYTLAASRNTVCTVCGTEAGVAQGMDGNAEEDGGAKRQKLDDCNGSEDGVHEDGVHEYGVHEYGVVMVSHQPHKVFVHGNYHRYYGYRLGKAFDEDPRLDVLEKRWFYKKKCLDVGCNEGLVTLSLAKAFGTTSMTGIDLDEHLIKRACTHLKEERSAAINQYVLSQQAGIDSKTRKDAKRIMQSLAQTWFVHGNILAGRIDRGSFDCITAFSVTKWIHLHSGDDGIRYFFSKVRDLLAPGGRFIVEPQSWKSYKSAASKMRKHKDGLVESGADSTYFFRLGDLKIRPDDFCTLLPEEFGLRFIRRLQPPSQTATGFDRDIYMFQKL